MILRPDHRQVLVHFDLRLEKHLLDLVRDCRNLVPKFGEGGELETRWAPADGVAVVQACCIHFFNGFLEMDLRTVSMTASTASFSASRDAEEALAAIK